MNLSKMTKKELINHIESLQDNIESNMDIGGLNEALEIIEEECKKDLSSLTKKGQAKRKLLRSIEYFKKIVGI